MNLNPYDSSKTAAAPSSSERLAEDSTRLTTGARGIHVLAATVAVGAASYLTIQKWLGNITDLAGCGGSEGCSQLLGGRWANWMLVPVSFWALTVYLPLLALGGWGLRSVRRAQLAWMGAGVLTAGAIWFIGLQLFVERKFCIWCFTMHTCSLVLLTSIAIQTRRMLSERPSLLRSGLSAAAIAATLLAAGQIWGPQPMSHQLTESFADSQSNGADEDVERDRSADSAADEPSGKSEVESPRPESGERTGERPADTDLATDEQLNRSAGSGVPEKEVAAELLGSGSTPTNQNDTSESLESPASPASSSTSSSASSHSPSELAAPSSASTVAKRDEPNDDDDQSFDRLPDFEEAEEVPSLASRGNDSSQAIEPSTSGDSTDPKPSAPELAAAVGSRRSPDAEATAASGGKASGGSGRQLEFLGGELKLNLADVPLVGDAAAPTVIVKYFDYTCKSCRTMHDDLTAIQEQFPGQLAIVMLPCPLDRDCNPFAPPGTAHRDACHYARLGLAVWRADRSKFQAFHDELFHRQGKISVAEARALAVQTVGEKELEKALQDPAIGAQLRRTFDLYRRMAMQNPRMPKVVLTGSVVMHGLARSRDELSQVLQQRAGLKAPHDRPLTP